jgi:hypothetical protein
MQENDVILVRANCCNLGGKLTQGNIDGFGEMTGSIFIRAPDIDDKRSVPEITLRSIRGY